MAAATRQLLPFRGGFCAGATGIPCGELNAGCVPATGGGPHEDWEMGGGGDGREDCAPGNGGGEAERSPDEGSGGGAIEDCEAVGGGGVHADWEREGGGDGMEDCEPNSGGGAIEDCEGVLGVTEDGEPKSGVCNEERSPGEGSGGGGGMVGGAATTGGVGATG